MREFNFQLATDALKDPELTDFLSKEGRSKATIYFEEYDFLEQDLQNYFGIDYKIGFEASPSDIVPMGESNDVHIRTSKSNLSELSESFNKGFAEMPYDISNRDYYLDQCKEIYNNGDCLSFFIGERFIGLNLIGRINIQGSSKVLFAWTWINKTITLNERKKLKHLIFMQITNEKSCIVASIHNKNKASISFLDSMNFKRICIIC